jgi:hypothetical protein
MASSSTRSIANSPFFAGNAEESHGGYAMVQAGPAVDPAEVETTELAVELIVRWSDTVLHVSHMSPARPFSVGEEGADLALPGTEQFAKIDVVGVSQSGPVALVPADAVARVMSGDQTMDLDGAIRAGLATSDRRVQLSRGVRVEFDLAGCTFEIAGVAAAKKVAGKAKADGRAFASQAASFALHAAVLGTMFVFMPALASTEDNPSNADQLYRLAATMQAAEQAREHEQSERLEGDVETKGGEQGSGAPSPGEAGAMGSQTSTAKNKKYALSGQAPERSLSRREMLADAQNFGMVSLLGNVATPTNEGPSAVWGTVAEGSDPLMANGNMWGDELGEASGTNGLYLSGIGEGGGGKFQGVGVGNISTIFSGSGTCDSGDCSGLASSTGRLSKGHKVGSPRLSGVGSSVSGRLPPEVVQRVVRQNFGRFRMCYEQGLRNNPNLAGRVSIAFTIGRDGSVGSAQNAGSDLPDAAVVSCVQSSFRALSFPAPDAGIVKVTYPIAFSPS